MRTDVHGEAAHVAATPDLDLAGVHTSSCLYAETVCGVDDGVARSHRPGRPVEHRQDAVAGGLDHVSTPFSHDALDEPIVVVEEVEPSAIAVSRGPVRRR